MGSYRRSNRVQWEAIDMQQSGKPEWLGDFCNGTMKWGGERGAGGGEQTNVRHTYRLRDAWRSELCL